MGMRYKLWDTDVVKLYDVSGTEEEAASLARTLLEGYPDDADDLELTIETDEGASRGNYSGASLARWADDVLAERDAANARRSQTASSHGGSSGIPIAAREG
ncbi:MAG: hypothetical protein ACR2LS_05330 [Thermomicrobiales bacterium]